MDWIKDFYSRSRERWGPSGVLPHHRERAARLARLCGAAPKRVLELGCGAGGTAAATADLGYDITALDIAPPAAAFARDLAREPRPGTMTILESDFFTVSLEGRFDAVAYWNGFGIGSDADQRRLLRRVASEWLAPGGCLLLDVFNPWPWARQAGQEKRVETDRGGPHMERFDFDPAGCRFIDQWWPVGAEDQAHAQTLRCYTPADFLLLLEGTGLEARHAEVAGEPFDIHRASQTMLGPSWEAWDYLVQLAPID